MTKKECRSVIRSLVKAMTEEEKRSESEKALQFIEQTDEFKMSHTILAYWSLSDEICTHSFIEKWSKEKRILLPVVVGDELEIREYKGKDNMLPGAFGILEPKGDAVNDLNGIGLAIIPSMAFNPVTGVRLGRGKGYYDRLNERLNQHTLKIGVCFKTQLCEEFEADEWDMKVERIVTAP